MCDALEAREKAKAQARMKRGKKQEPCVDSTQGQEGRTRDLLAAKVGWGWQTYERAKAVVEAARENATQRGMSSTALTGTVASAMKYVAKTILSGVAEKFFSNFDLPTLRRRLRPSQRVLPRSSATCKPVPSARAGGRQKAHFSRHTESRFSEQFCG